VEALEDGFLPALFALVVEVELALMDLVVLAREVSAGRSLFLVVLVNELALAGV
jgi:hypothetical protein